MAKYFLFISFYGVMIIHHLNYTGGCDSSQDVHTKCCSTTHVMVWMDSSVPGEVSSDRWL